MEIYRTDFRYPLIRVEKLPNGKAAAMMVADHLLVKRLPGMSHAEFIAKLDALGLEVRHRLYGDSGYLVTAPAATLDPATALESIAARLAPDPVAVTVRLAEPDFIASINRLPADPRFYDLVGMFNSRDADIDALEAWDISTDASNVTVAVIDTGIDLVHEDLAANLWSNPGETAGNGVDDDGNGLIDDVHGWDFVNGDADPTDDNYHGTHCAGTIGAAGNNFTGVTGVAWSVRLMALKVLDADGGGTASSITEAIAYATEMGANVTSNSYGGPFRSTAITEAAVAEGEAGCIHIAAAGNDGAEIVAAGVEGNHTYIVSENLELGVGVAATDPYDQLAYFSNYGETVVHLAAPGTNILSTVPGNQYDVLSGTSMATPHVAGAAAMLLGLRPDLGPAEVKSRLMASVDHLPSLMGKVASGGRLNLHRLLANAHVLPPVVSGTLPGTLVFGQPWSGQIQATGLPHGFSARGLPPGLTIDPVSGLISGIPAQTGTFQVRLSAMNDAAGGTLEWVVKIAVAPPGLAATAQATGARFQPFRYRIVTVGQPDLLTTSPLPPGLSFDAASGVISGTSLSAGIYSVVVSASNALGTSTQVLTITIAAASAPEFAPLVIRSASVSSNWSLALSASSMPTRFGASGLPPGLAIHTPTGLISGKPTATGNFTVQVEAENAAGIGRAAFNLTVRPSGVPVLGSDLVHTLQVGTFFSYLIGSTPSFQTMESIGLPPGLERLGGVINGIPTQAGIWEVQLKAGNSTGTGTAVLRLVVTPPGPQLSGTLTPAFVSGDPFSYPLAADDAAATISVGTLPPGLAYESGPRRIVGTVLTPGLYPIQVTLNGINGSRTQVIQLRVHPRAPVISGPFSAYVAVGEPFSYQIKASNWPASFSATSLPPGLTIDSASGRITGIVQATGQHAIGISATNGGGEGHAVLNLTVDLTGTRITSFSPLVVNPSEEITIRGSGFTGATQVSFADRYFEFTPAEEFTVVSDSEIRARVPYIDQYHSLHSEQPFGSILVLAPRGISVTFPASALNITTPYALGTIAPYAVVKAGGSLNLQGGRARLAIEKGGSALFNETASANFILLGGGSVLQLAPMGTRAPIFASPAATVLHEPPPDVERPAVIEVAGIHVAYLPTLEVRQLPQFDSPGYAIAATGKYFDYRVRTLGYPDDSEVYSIVGSLPGGLAFDPSKGTIRGTPHTPGVYTFTLKLTNALGSTTLPFELTVIGPALPMITSGGVAKAQTGVPFSFQVSVVNGPAQFSATGLPAGLEINPSSGLIHGTPTVARVSQVTLTATNAGGSWSSQLSLVIGLPTLAIESYSPAVLPKGATMQVRGRGLGSVLGVHFIGYPMKVVDAPAWTLNSDSEMEVTVPPLNQYLPPATRSPLIARGTDYTAVTFPANAVRYSTSGTAANSASSIIVGAGATVSVGSSRNLIYVESGGTVVVSSGGSLSAVFLEDGATLSGRVSIVIRSPGGILINQENNSSPVFPVSSLTLSTVADNNQILVLEPPEIIAGDAVAILGQPFHHFVQVDSYHIAELAFEGLPPGLVADGHVCAIAGIPTMAGSYVVKLTAKDQQGEASKEVIITVSPPVLLPVPQGSLRVDGNVGTTIDRQLAAQNGPVTWSATGLPAGLSLSPAGRLTGQVSQKGVWTANLTLTNTAGNTAAKLVVAIGRPPPLIATHPLATFPGREFPISGTNFDQVTTVGFRSVVGTGKGELLGSTIVSTAASGITVTTPNLIPTYRMYVVELESPGGVAMDLPDKLERIPTGEVVFDGSIQACCVAPGATLVGGQSVSRMVYVQAGGKLVLRDASSTVIYAEDGAMVDIEEQISCFVVATPNARVNVPADLPIIRVAGLSPGPVTDYVRASLLPVIDSADQVQARVNVPFVYQIHANNNPTGFSAAGLPPGLVFNSATATISGLPFVTGTTVVQLTATNTSGNFSAPLTIITGGADDPFTGDLADPDGDSMPNLLENAAKLGSNTRNSPADFARGQRVGSEFRFTYRRLRGTGTGSTETGYVIHGFRYLVETSSDAKQWSSGATRSQQVGLPVDNGDGSESVTVRLLEAGSQAFARLKVERLPNP